MIIIIMIITKKNSKLNVRKNLKDSTNHFRKKYFDGKNKISKRRDIN